MSDVAFAGHSQVENCNLRLRNIPASFLQEKLFEMFSQFDLSDSSEGNLFLLFHFSDFSPINFYSQNCGHRILEFNMKNNMFDRKQLN